MTFDWAIKVRLIWWLIRDFMNKNIWYFRCFRSFTVLGHFIKFRFQSGNVKTNRKWNAHLPFVHWKISKKSYKFRWYDNCITKMSKMTWWFDAENFFLSIIAKFVYLIHYKSNDFEEKYRYMYSNSLMKGMYYSLYCYIDTHYPPDIASNV